MSQLVCICFVHVHGLLSVFCVVSLVHVSWLVVSGLCVLTMFCACTMACCLLSVLCACAMAVCLGLCFTFASKLHASWFWCCLLLCVLYLLFAAHPSVLVCMVICMVIHFCLNGIVLELFRGLFGWIVWDGFGIVLG